MRYLEADAPLFMGNPYRFSGKERTPADYDFGARRYLPFRVPRWTTMDPMAEKYFPITPYAYCAGDPVNLVDPEGMDTVPKAPEDKMGTPEYYFWREEEYYKRTGTHSSYYGEYGYKYALRFKALKESGNLSEMGEKWVEEVMLNLQKAIEQKLEGLGNYASEFEDNALKNEPELRVFAFNTHADAYKNIKGKAPLSRLKFSDYIQIIHTIDPQDIFSWEGVSQFVNVGLYLTPIIMEQTLLPFTGLALVGVNLLINGKI